MKLTLPLALLACLFACLNTAYAQDSTGETTTEPSVSSPVVNPADGGYTQPAATCNIYISQDVVWTEDYNYNKLGPATYLSVGCHAGDGSLSVTNGATVNVANCLNVGGRGYQYPVPGEETAQNNAGRVYVGKDSTLEIGVEQTDAAGSQLHIGSGGQGEVEVDGGTLISNYLLNVGYTAVGELMVTNGGKVEVRLPERIVDSFGAAGGASSSNFYIGYGSGGQGTVTLDKNSTLSMSASGTRTTQTYIGLSGGNGTLEVLNGSEATLGVTTFIGTYSGDTGAIKVNGGTLHATNVYAGYQGVADITVAGGGLADIQGELILSYKDIGKGTLTVEGTGSELAVTGGAFVGNEGTGELNVKTGGKAELRKNLEVNAGSKLNVSGGSEVTVGTVMNVEDKAVATITDSKLKVAQDLSVNGTGKLSLTKSDLTVGGTLTNYGTVEVDLTKGGSFKVGSYSNYGSSTIKVAEGTECSFGSIELADGSMTMQGGGAITLGGATEAGAEAPVTTFTVSGQTETTNIDVSAMQGANFKVDEGAVFTLDFTSVEGLGALEEGQSQAFTLHLIIGSDGFTMDETALATLLSKTDYTFESDVATVAMAYALETAAAEGVELKYRVQTGSDAYSIQERAATEDTPAGYDLVWTGTIEAYNANPAVPEPATATLSLLALAGLMARRRRR